jgi:hypothetical protein
MGACRIHPAEAACLRLVVRSHSRFGVVKAVVGEAVTVAEELWKRVVGLDGVLRKVSMWYPLEE